MTADSPSDLPIPAPPKAGWTQQRPEAREDPQELMSLVQQGTLASRMLEFIDEHIEAKETAIRDQIFAVLDSKSALDPQKAVQAWIEVRALHAFPKELRKQVRDGIRAGEKLEKQGDV